MRTLIAIPVHNEVDTLVGLLERVRRYSQGCDILAVDDGSTDGSADILSRVRDITVLTHGINLGYGRTLIDAFDYADQAGYDWIITLDADEQHDPRRIPDFLDMARRDDADILSGSRYMHADPRVAAMVPGDRRRINHLITVLINNALCLNLTDSFCGFKAHRVAAIRDLHLTVPGYAFPLQFWVQVARAGLRVREVPIQLIYHDPTRTFGGGLDDATFRLRHYIEVLVQELAVPDAWGCTPYGSACGCPSGQC